MAKNKKPGIVKRFFQAIGLVEKDDNKKPERMNTKSEYIIEPVVNKKKAEIEEKEEVEEIDKLDRTIFDNIEEMELENPESLYCIELDKDETYNDFLKEYYKYEAVRTEVALDRKTEVDVIKQSTDAPEKKTNPVVNKKTQSMVKKKTEPVEKKNDKVSKKKTESGVKRKTTKQTVEKVNGIQRFQSVEEFCDTYIDVIQEEIGKAKKEKKQSVFAEGRRVGKNNNSYLYSFDLDDEYEVFSNTAVDIELGKLKVEGYVEWCDKYQVAIRTKSDLGEIISAKLNFANNTWQLQTHLQERLEFIKNNQSSIVKSLVCDSYNECDYNCSGIAQGKEKAYQLVNELPITFIWGPPGTGKTYTLANMAYNYMKKGYRILVLSHSNVAVDGAIKKIYAKDMQDCDGQNPVKLKEGQVIRYGYPKDDNLRNNESASPYMMVLKENPELAEQVEILNQEKKNFTKTSAEYINCCKSIEQIGRKLFYKEKDIVRQATVVATTACKATMDEVIYEDNFDVVIFDEASMAYIPQIVYAASLATKHFVCIGDFRQLPPIVVSGKQSQLNYDIFQYAKINEAVDNNVNHNWLVMLNEQYRMHPKIADCVSRNMYNGLLVTNDDVKEKREGYVNRRPFAHSFMTIADMSGMMSTCLSDNSSKFNVLTALLDMGMAYVAPREQEIGVITPYRTQANLLHAISKDLDRENISCSTVHKFQGSERNIIIYDPVECYLANRWGTMLVSSENDYANRMFNVALTRAKDKFITTVNVDYFKDKKMPKKLFYMKTIEELEEQQEIFALNKVVRECKSDSMYNEKMKFFYTKKDVEKVKKMYLKDIGSAMEEIKIDIPRPPRKGNLPRDTAIEIKKIMAQRDIKVSVRAEKESNILKEFNGILKISSNARIPLTIIDKRIVWYGVPFSSAHFTAGSHKGKTELYPMIRLEGKNTAKMLIRLMKMY